MDLLTLILLGTIFLFTSSLVGFGYLFWTESRLVEKRQLKRRLLSISAGGRHGQEKLSIYKERAVKDGGLLGRLWLCLPRMSSLDRLLIRSNLPLNATSFVLLSLALGGFGIYLGLRYSPNPAISPASGLLLLSLPSLWLKAGSGRYLAKFEEQLPEALDLMGRALRSGHALSSGLEMVATEMPGPIGPEFGAIIDETKLGLTLKEAMENLCERIPSQDLRFFVVAILIQKETGGNIAEILDNISRLIRERIQFKRHVSTLTAEGRMSSIILIALPIVLFLYIFTVNYNYLSALWLDPKGQYLLVTAIVLQIIGFFVIRKIVKVEI